MDGRRGRVTLVDVARTAGVSKAVASAVLSGSSGTVRAGLATREKVLSAARRLGYAPHYGARSLRRSRANRITLVVHDLANPYYADIATAAAAAATARGFELHVLQAGRPEAERGAIEKLRSGFSDAVLVATSRHGQEHAALPALCDLAHRGIPTVVLIDRSPDPAIPAVRIDDEAAAWLGTTHLLRLGHRRIAYLGGPPSPRDLPVSHAVDRRQGYRRALEEAGLSADPRLERRGAITSGGGRELARQILAERDRPTALFCFNDMVAIGAISALHEAGLSVPDEMAVVGFDGIELGEFAVPPLTTVAHSRADLGQAAVDAALARLDGELAERERLLPVELVVRRSCGADAPRRWPSQEVHGREG